MSAFTKIGWTDHTFNSHIGCAKVSRGCDHCYAELERATRALGVAWGPGQPRHRTSAVNWRNPKKWHAAHTAFFVEHGRRQRVFCASLSDWADNEIPIEWTVDLLELVRITTNLDWQMLTKRIGNVVKRLVAAADWIREHAADTMSVLLAWIERWLAGEPPSHVWLGISVVNQEEADRDIPKLLATPAALRFVSMEPLLGAVVIAPYLPGWLWHQEQGGQRTAAIDWVIVGGESGRQARPMNPEWVRSLRDQCDVAGVPFFMKQWGTWYPTQIDNEDDAFRLPDGKRLELTNENGRVLLESLRWKTTWSDPVEIYSISVRLDKERSGRLLDGVLHDAFPESPADRAARSVTAGTIAETHYEVA